MNLPTTPQLVSNSLVRSRFSEDVTWIIANSHRHSRCALFWCSRIPNCHSTDIYSTCHYSLQSVLYLSSDMSNFKSKNKWYTTLIESVTFATDWWKKRKRKLCGRVPRDQSGWDLTDAERWLNELVSRPSSTSQLPAHVGGGLDSLNAEVKVMFPSQSLWRTRRKSSSQTVNFNEYKAA